MRFRQRYPSTESVVALSYAASSITHASSKVGVVCHMYSYCSGCGHLHVSLHEASMRMRMSSKWFIVREREGKVRGGKVNATDNGMCSVM